MAGARAAAAAASPVAGFVVARHLAAPLGPAPTSSGAGGGEEDLPSAPLPAVAAGGTGGVKAPAAAEEDEEDAPSMAHGWADAALAAVAAH